MNRVASLLLPAVAATFLTSVRELPAQKAPAAAKPTLSAAAYGRLPLSFEATQDKADAGVQFLSHGQGYTLKLRPDDATLALYDSPATAPAPHRRGTPQPVVATKPAVIDMKLLGANPRATAAEEDLQITHTNYLIGNDPKLWRTGIPNYGRVRYHSVYSGIDLVYYGHQRQLEYDFIVAPHADPSQIRLQFNGADSLALTDAGDLTISTSDSSIAFNRPVIYQQLHGRRVHVDGEFELAADHTAAFRLGRYDHTLPLVIDPKIEYSTYYGFDTHLGIYCLAVDPGGDLYFGGASQPGLALVSPLSSTPEPKSTGFISEINPTGTAILYATYFGGTSGNDYVNGLALDSSGNIYATGGEYSSDFPTLNSLQTTGSAFVAEIAAGGASLIYSTRVGGTNGDYSNGIALDAANNAYIAGNTYSSDFVLKNPIQSTSTDPYGNGFAAEVAAGGTSLVYATYIRGTGACDGNNNCLGDYLNTLAADRAGNLYIAGATASYDFPTVNAIQTYDHNGTSGWPNPYGPDLPQGTTTGFVSKIQPGGGAFVFSTYLGGSGQCYFPMNNQEFGNPYPVCSGDSANSITVDSLGNALVAGTAASGNFPLYHPYRSSGGAVSTGFISAIKSDGSAFLWSTYFGGSGECPWTAPDPYGVEYQNCFGDGIASIALDPLDNVYVTGYTASPDYPTLYPFQTKSLDTDYGANTPFVASLKADGQSLVYSSYLGGSAQDSARKIVADAAGDAFVSGVAVSADFPTYMAIQGKNRGNSPFITKISLAKSPALRPVIAPAAGTYSTPQSVKITGGTPGTIYYTLDGSTPTNTSPRYTGPIAVRTPETVKATTYATGYAPSVVVSAAYDIKLPAAAPVFSPPAGTYATNQSIKLTFQPRPGQPSTTPLTAPRRQTRQHATPDRSRSRPLRRSRP